MSNRLRGFVVSNHPGAGATLPSSASVMLMDTDRGFVPNKLTTGERDAIESPVAGLLIYNITTLQNEYYNGASWNSIGSDSSTFVNTITESDLTLDSFLAWDLIYDGDSDDAYFEIDCPFNIVWQGIEYGSVFVSSNSYLTFGQGWDLFYDFLSIPSPAVFLSAADNSIQRLYIYSDANVLKIRYEGTDSTGGVNGDPTMLWQANFYADTPNVIDIIFGQNLRQGGITGTATYGAWVLEHVSKFQDEAVRFTSTGVSLPDFSGQVDFTQAIHNVLSFEDAVGYWKFDDLPGQRVAVDRGPLGLDGIASGNASFGARSVIPDENSGLIIHNDGFLDIPFDSSMIAVKGENKSVLFAVQYTDRSDYLTIEMGGLNDTEAYQQNWQIDLWDGGAAAILFNEGNGTWLRASTANGAAFTPVLKALVCMSVDFSGNMTLWVNDKKVQSNSIVSVGSRPTGGNTITHGVLRKESNIETGIRITGGIDSPVISHLLVFPFDIGEGNYRSILGLSGILETKVQSDHLDDAFATSMMKAVVLQNSPVTYWPMGDQNGDNCYLSETNDSVLVYQSGSNAQVGTPTVPDGLSSAEMNLSVLDNHFWETTFFESTSFTLMAVFHAEGLGNSPALAMNIRHFTNSEETVNRLDVHATVDSPFGVVLYNTEGAPYLTIDSDLNMRVGDRVVIFVRYDSGGDILTLNVNNRQWLATGGTGTRQDGLAGELIAGGNSNFTLSASGNVSHIAWFNSDLNDHFVREIMSASTIVPKVDSEYTNEFTIEGYVFTVQNGIITNVVTPG